MRAALALALLLGLLLAGCSGDSDQDGAGERRPATTTRVEVVERLEDEGQGFNPQAIYQNEGPGVVTVYSMFAGGANGGVGSGFVIDGKGEIATNAHVITVGTVPNLRQASDVYVEFLDGNKVKAEIVGHDPYVDIGLLRVDPEGLTLRPLPLGSSADLVVGEPVAAIGSPYTERNSLSVGVISAVDRTIDSLTNFAITGAIQTDAAINPGNSGGPLVNATGEVIGVNQQILTSTGGSEGVGFAVPIDAVKRSLAQLRETGEAKYAYLGLSTFVVYPQLAERYDLPVDEGLLVQGVESDDPAERAGLRGGDRTEVFQGQRVRVGGDIIVEVDGDEMATTSDLAAAIADRRPGEQVAVEIVRDGERRTLRVSLGERPLQASGRP